jgi:6-phosphogluconate dehydrogenase
MVNVIVFIATFNNITAISRQSVLLVEGTGSSGGQHGSRRGRDRMVVGFTTAYAISAYHH